MTSAAALPRIGVLAIQGSFALHIGALEAAGAEAVRVRGPDELEGLAGLVIPGGESTVIDGVAREVGLLDEIPRAVERGLAVFGTCAGAILLGRGHPPPQRLELVPVEVERNAYGRQRESFEKELRLIPFEAPFRGIFIRAPRIHLPPRHEERGIEVLAWEDDARRERPVLLRHRRCLLATFHPELTADHRIHEYFVRRIASTEVAGARA